MLDIDRRFSTSSTTKRSCSFILQRSSYRVLVESAKEKTAPRVTFLSLKRQDQQFRRRYSTHMHSRFHQHNISHVRLYTLSHSEEFYTDTRNRLGTASTVLLGIYSSSALSRIPQDARSILRRSKKTLKESCTTPTYSAISPMTNPGATDRSRFYTSHVKDVIRTMQECGT